MRHFSEVLQSSRKWVALFALTVLFPALLLALVAVRAFRGEGSWQRYQEKERQEKTVRLLERDLDDWLFSIRSKPPTSDPLFTFQIRGDEILFPALNVTVSTYRLREAGSELSSEDLRHWYETQRSEWVPETAGSHDKIHSVYLRLMETHPRLAPLARLSLFRIALQTRQSREAMRWFSAIHRKDMGAVTESGVPTWIAAALMLASSPDACRETNSAEHAFSGFVKTALAGLRDGRWKLTAAQWIVYVEEFRSALKKCQGKNSATSAWGESVAAMSGTVQRLQTLAELHPQLLSLRREARAATTSGITAEKRYEPKLSSLIVFLSFVEPAHGLIVDAGLLKLAAQQRLDKLTVAEDFRGAILMAQNGGSTNQEVRLASFPAIQIRFTEKEQAGGLLSFQKHFFLYATGFLLLVCVLGLFYTYRAVSHEVAVSRLKADFVAAVSHEFRSPLTSILALLERVETGRVREPETLNRYHRVIHQEVHRLNLLVNSLLDFARLEEGRKEFSFQPCNVPDLARDVVQSFHNLGHGERVNLVESETDLPAISADRMAIAQCIQNLIDNAIKYSPKDLPVLVETGRENGMIYLEVSDRGPGIPLSEQDKIFEQFYRARNTDIHNVKGAGLGLALVKRIMESHGGRVTVESRPGEGSKFRLVFPFVR